VGFKHRLKSLTYFVLTDAVVDEIYMKPRVLKAVSMLAATHVRPSAEPSRKGLKSIKGMSAVPMFEAI
jgi:hypothetical protein